MNESNTIWILKRWKGRLGKDLRDETTLGAFDREHLERAATQIAPIEDWETVHGKDHVQMVAQVNEYWYCLMPLPFNQDLIAE